MVMNWERIEPWEYVVVSVAAEYHKKYDMVEFDDIKQSLYEWFVSHARKLTEWEALGPKDAKNLLYRSLRNQALDYCQLWKSKSLGYETSDLFYYEPVIVEALLPTVIRGDMSVAPVINLGMPGRPPAPAEGGNLMAMMVEVEIGFDKLSPQDKLVLIYKHGEGLDYTSIANIMELGTDDAARMRHKRAVKRLIAKLGGFRPFHDSVDVEFDDIDGHAEQNDEANDSDYDTHT